MLLPAKISIVVSIVAVSFAAGVVCTRLAAPAGPASHRIRYYHDPMHPAYRSDKPGVAPDCGMPLEPVYDTPEADQPESQPSLAPGSVQVSVQKQQALGMRTESAAIGPASYTLRVAGRVAADETRVARVAGAVDGWVRSAGPYVPGSKVRKGDVLATYYNRDFLTAQQTYLYALNTMDRFRESKENEEQLKLTGAQMRAAEENLEFLGMSHHQIEDIARTREIARNIEIRAPTSGVLLARGVYPGLRFERGAELYRIAELDRVWIFAEVSEKDASLIAALQSARAIYRGNVLALRYSDSFAQFDPASRSMRVRMEADNPGLALRPEMFVDVELKLKAPAGVSVPVDAVVDSGLRKTVFVDRGNASFEPRAIETGARMGERVVVTRGLAAGERVVVSGTFLIDSESRLQLAAERTKAAPAKDPACGMLIDISAAAARSEFNGKMHYFCSSTCKGKFDRDPAKYLGNRPEAMPRAALRRD